MNEHKRAMEAEIIHIAWYFNHKFIEDWLTQNRTGLEIFNGNKGLPIISLQNKTIITPSLPKISITENFGQIRSIHYYLESKNDYKSLPSKRI